MNCIFVYGTYRYEYNLELGDRKTFTLIVRPDLQILVRAPHGAGLSDIEAFLARKWRWLEKQLRELRKYQRTHIERQYVSGESWYYLGRQYMLQVTMPINGQEGVRLARGKMWLHTSRAIRDGNYNKQILEEWYAGRRNYIFKREYIKVLKQFNLSPMPQIKLRAMTKRWGSYTKSGVIVLNPRLIEAPTEAIRYVLIHELCHTISAKHDEVFYAALDVRQPNWRTIKQRLELKHG